MYCFLTNSGHLYANGKGHDHLKYMRRRKKIDHNGSGWVFCRLDDAPVKRFDKAWRRACNEAGIKGFHFHDLRYPFCSNLMLAGYSLKDVKEMIGHRDLPMTDRYSHLTIGHKHLQQTRLAENYSLGR